MTLTDDQLTLFEKVLYHEAFDGQLMQPEPVGYADIEYIAHSGWIARRDGMMLHPWYYCPAPLNPECQKMTLKVTSMSNATSGDRPKFEFSPGVAHQKSDAESFGGQHQDAAQSNDRQIDQTPTQSKFGEYWVERVYKTIKGKTYGPYLVQRWRDENGKKRSRYLGKAQKRELPETNL